MAPLSFEAPSSVRIGPMEEVPSRINRRFHPCAATPSMLLYANGNSIFCARYNTLIIERRFTCHTETIRLLAVDNISEKGTGRLVVSYDEGQTAIIWDCLTGEELSKFAAYQAITAVSWCRNGNVVMGEFPVYGCNSIVRIHAL
jgi:WD40 repeat protein